jgi:hypothetical protein
MAPAQLLGVFTTTKNDDRCLEAEVRSSPNPIIDGAEDGGEKASAPNVRRNRRGDENKMDGPSVMNGVSTRMANRKERVA